ncbi:MAG: calcium/sodium antiporter [Chitinispirillaceae bacterium]|nr:calcium/sodium antiporter [Chitinispirillaceae bacterium]
MEFLETAIETNQILAWAVLVTAFVILAKCADLFVDSAVALADRFNIPRLVIGIVMVSLATTAPEVSVSLISALQGSPEMALGNAIGSVICDDGIALGLAGLFTAAPIMILPSVLNTSAIFLILVEVLTFLFIVFDHQLGRIEGGILVVLLGLYFFILYRQHKSGKHTADAEIAEELESIDKTKGKPLTFLFLIFAIGLAGIIGSSHFIVTSATSIAHYIGIPEAVIALTLVALGTSIPEIATCIIAARKGEGALAVGNILGADILNICWVAGLSAVANPLTLSGKQIFFMFPSMFIIVGTMLLMLRAGYRLTKVKGLVLLGLYGIYVASFFFVFPPTHH